MRTALIGSIIALTLGAAPALAAPAPAATTTTGATAAKAMPQHPSSAGGFQSEAAAKAHCPSDTVMWGNSSTKVLHYAGSTSFGKTKHGSYMCESEATKAGYHVAKGEKHP